MVSPQIRGAHHHALAAAEALIGRGNPFIRGAKLSQFDHKKRVGARRAGRAEMRVSLVMSRLGTAQPTRGTAFAPAPGMTLRVQRTYFGSRSALLP